MTIGAAVSSGRPQAYMRLAELLIGSRIALTLRVVAERPPARADVLPGATGQACQGRVGG